MLFFGIVLFLGVIIWSLVLCNFLYRDAFVGNNAESEEVEKSFFQIKRCIIFWYTIMMLIDGTAFGAYQFFNWSFDFMWLLVGMLLTEMLLCFIPGYLIFQKFKNDHNLVPFSAWKITRTLWFSRVGFFVYALCLYVLSDQSLREEVWFFPFLQWVMFMNHFVFVSEKQELTVSSVLLSMMSISLFVIISFGILESADKGIMRTIGVGEKNVVVEFDKRVCNRAARMLQCNNASLHLDNCIFYHIEVPSAIGEERLVNIPINQFKTLTGCQLSKKSKQEISETGAVFLQIIVSQDEINTGRFLDESGKLVKNKKGHLVK
jgi:hypothetical protein